MYRVFLAEDESVVREGLKNSIPWQQLGFEFVGDASDGELALQKIRHLDVDLLITDIKMPFIDGLNLCHILHQEFPKLKIIIISGYDDFEYAKRAIDVGVEKYLSKPITRRALQSALEEVRDKLDQEHRAEDYLRQFQLERQEYEQAYRRHYFEQLFSGRLSVEETYLQAERLGLNLSGSCFNLILFAVSETRRQAAGERESEHPVDQILDSLSGVFLEDPHCLFFRWSMSIYGVIVKGTKEEVAATAAKIPELIRANCENRPHLEWYVASGDPVDRFSRLDECYHEAYHLLSRRFVMPHTHILSKETAGPSAAERELKNVEQIEPGQVDPEIVRAFLRGAQDEEIDDFLDSYLGGLQEPLRSRMFRDYMILSIHFTVAAFLKELGADEGMPEELAGGLQEAAAGPEQMRCKIRELFLAALRERDACEGIRGSRILKEAVDYIDEHYNEEDLSLNRVAEAVFVSSNYFSAMFSQKMEMTFIEYVTGKRMEKAKELLKDPSLRTAQIASAVGYRDPHYFSFVFKKTVGMTPREYRNAERGEGS